MAKIKVNQLAAQIAEELALYSQEVIEKVDEASERIGKETVELLKATSPKRTGQYARKWTMTTVKVIGMATQRFIHVKKRQYRLTHLLEHGHAKRGGGRVEGKPHIRPAEEEMIRKFTSEVEGAIERG